MRVRVVLSGMLLTLVPVVPAFGQALAEGAMVHANAAAATAKAGTALGDSLNKAMSNNADRLHSITQGASQPSTGGQVQTVPRSASPASAATHAASAPTSANHSASGGLQITSIRGGSAAPKPACTSATATSSATPANPGTANTAAQPCASTSTQPTKSVVHVNFPQ